MNLRINSDARLGTNWVIIEEGADDPVRGQKSLKRVAEDAEPIIVEVEFVTYPGNIPTPVYIDTETGYLFVDGEALTGQYDQATLVCEFIRAEQVGVVRGYFHIDNVVLSGRQTS